MRKIRLTVPARHRDLADLVGASRPRLAEFLLHLKLRETDFEKLGRLKIFSWLNPAVDVAGP
jgi:hypothetical protein